MSEKDRVVFNQLMNLALSVGYSKKEANRFAWEYLAYAIKANQSVSA